ncbi:MAG: hypothetical protein RBQ97_00685 [Acholeplasma sp.]|nr:hypothetical protein [Acholeplasma sp.]
MKINNKIYRSLTGEPFLTQDLSGKKVELFYMNDTPFLAQYVSRGRFYLWTSDGKDYKLLVEKGFYEKMNYFFDAKINEIWLNFLEDVGNTNSKMSKMFMGISLGISTLIIILIALFWREQLMMGVIVALFLTMIVNMVQSSKINRLVKEKNYEAQMKIKEVLTEEGFNKLLNDQDEYMKEYFKFEEDDENFDEEDNEEVELIEEEIVVEDDKENE